MMGFARYTNRRMPRWALAARLALPAAALMAGCGGGGDDPPTASMTLEDARAVKLASILIEVTPSTATFYNSAIDASILDGWATPPGSESNGCETRTRQKLRSLPTASDTNLISYDCQFVHGNHDTFSSSLVVKGQQTHTLEELSDPQMPVGAAWRYREQWVSRTTSNYGFALLDGTAMDGQTTGNTTYGNLAEHAADGSQVDTTTFDTRGTETGSRGNSDFTMQASIRCTFAPGALQAGDCVNTAARLQGTIYGQAVDATLTRLSTNPLTYAIDNGTQRTTVVVEKVGPDIPDSRYRVLTPAGTEVRLTGEDTNWLGVF